MIYAAHKLKPVASSHMHTHTDASFEDFQHDDSSIELEDCDNQQFSLWVSFAEIYNEFIYDLLVEPPTKARARTCLKIREDKNSNQFIKGMPVCFFVCLCLHHAYILHTHTRTHTASHVICISTCVTLRLEGDPGEQR